MLTFKEPHLCCINHIHIKTQIYFYNAKLNKLNSLRLGVSELREGKQTLHSRLDDLLTCPHTHFLTFFWLRKNIFSHSTFWISYRFWSDFLCNLAWLSLPDLQERRPFHPFHLFHHLLITLLITLSVPGTIICSYLSELGNNYWQFLTFLEKSCN